MAEEGPPLYFDVSHGIQRVNCSLLIPNVLLGYFQGSAKCTKPIQPKGVDIVVGIRSDLRSYGLGHVVNQIRVV